MKIGTKGATKAPSDAVEMLTACHERIREFSALALKLGEAESPPTEQVADAAAKVVRYFAEALPLHVRDEDESIAPRLRGISPTVDAALAAVESEHREHDALVARVVERCARLRDEPGRHAAERGALAQDARALCAGFADHLAREERVIFPAIREALPEAERAALVNEMRARRGR